jgi:hypothetical protein
MIRRDSPSHSKCRRDPEQINLISIAGGRGKWMKAEFLSARNLVLGAVAILLIPFSGCADMQPVQTAQIGNALMRDSIATGRESSA